MYPSVIKTFKEMGIRKIGAYSYLFEENGGFDNVGFTKQYFYNFVKKQKLIKIEVGDCENHNPEEGQNLTLKKG